MKELTEFLAIDRDLPEAPRYVFEAFVLCSDWMNVLCPRGRKTDALLKKLEGR